MRAPPAHRSAIAKACPTTAPARARGYAAVEPKTPERSPKEAGFLGRHGSNTSVELGARLVLENGSRGFKCECGKEEDERERVADEDGEELQV
ncbi:hypothetical protein C0992_004765 [Termitomyces sp. T32_za158]|nr:hypothetical protein C0992_004765 [Termitomyces sp. T32_za158]